MKVFIIFSMFMVSHRAMAFDAVFLVPTLKAFPSMSEAQNECKIVYGSAGNYVTQLGKIVHPPYEDLRKAMEIDNETAQLVRTSFGYHDGVPLDEVKTKLEGWQKNCETSQKAKGTYRNSFVCSTEGTTGGFGGKCDDMRQLVMKMNEHIYHYPNYDWLINIK